MSAKFRSNRKYRVSSGNYSNTSRPMTASSTTSMEESYHSDFEALDGPNVDEDKSNLFFLGESINDKLNLTSEFNVGGSLLEEDEDNYSTYDNQAIIDEQIKDLVHPERDEEEEYEYEYEFSSPISTAKRVVNDITSPYQAYDDDVFEIASPMQLSHDPNDPRQRDIFSTGTTSPHQQSNIPIIVENATDDHQTILPSHQQPSISFHEASTAENTLAEFSSITFGNSEVIQPAGKKKRKKKVTTIVDPSVPSEKKNLLGKIPKKRVATPGLPTIKSPRSKNAAESSSPKSIPSKFQKQSPRPPSNNQMISMEKNPPLPPRPKSHPVKSSVNSSISNKKSRNKVQSANSRNHSSSSQRPRAEFETPIKLPKVNNVDGVGRGKDENDADGENEEDDDFDDDGTRKSNKTHATRSSAIKYQKIPITTESSVIGKPSLTTFSYYNSGSVVTSRGHHYSEATLPIPELQKQYRLALKQIKELKEKNQTLLDQLDTSKIQETIQNYQYQLIQKQQLIDQLTSENISYKTIIRNQEKGLIQHSNEKQQEFDILEHQEKDIEVLFEQLKRVKKKMFVHKEKELEKQLIIDDLKLQVNKLKQRNNKWKKQFEHLSISHEEVLQRLQEKESRNDLTSAEQRSSNDLLPSPTTLPVSNKPKPDLIEESSVIVAAQIEAIEKRYNAQMKVLQYDNQSYKQDILQKQKLIDQFTKELQKRDFFIQHQTSLLKSLKFSYQELSENCHHLLQGSILAGRDSKKPTPVKHSPPPNQHPKHRKTEIPKLKAKPPEQKKGLLVIDESEEEEEIKKEENEVEEGQMKEQSASSANILALLDLDDVKESQKDPYGSMLNDDNELKMEENPEKANIGFFITEESEVDEYEDEEYENED